MNAFTIRDLENLSGIKAHTIRVWEQRYSFLKPQRTDTNIRYYTNRELKTILNISLLNKYGYKISHIDRMSDVEIKDKILSLSHAQAQQERIINELIEHMVDMDIDSFEIVLNNYILARGIERTITYIIFPFLERIGILWLTSHINPAQEHLVTNVIRQKLISGIETCSTHLEVNKLILMFLPENEHHELALLFTFYMMRSRGIKVLYLGANVPLADIEFVVKAKQPDYLFTHITSAGGNFNFEKFIQRLTARIHQTPIIVSGRFAQQYRKPTPENVFLKRSFTEVLEFISSMKIDG